MIFLILLLHLYLLVHTGFTAWPEMFSYPYLFDRGFLLYKDIAHVYQPLLTFTLYGVFKIFGYKLLTLKVFTWGIILINDLLIFKLLKGRRLAWIVVLIYAITQVFFEGDMLWFDLAATPFILLLLKSSLEANYLLMGVFLALCVLVKQQTILLIIPVLFVLVKNRGSWLKILLGGLIPTVPVLAWIYSAGIFEDYIFWSLTFPILWLPRFSSYPAWPTTNQWLVVLLLTLPILIGLFKKLNWTLILFFGVLLTAAFPRFSYFHLQPGLVIYAIVLGRLLVHKHLRIWLLLLSIGTASLVVKPQYFQDRFYDEDEASEIATLVKPDEKVFLLGPHSLLYVLAGRVPPKPWIDNYVWHFEIPGVQQRQISAWEKDPPAYVFRTPPQPGRWDQLGVYQPKTILNYIYNHYNKIGQTSEGIEVWRRL